jgi:CheY-like chemotaxis protein
MTAMRGRVVAVEDDPLVCDMLATLLAELGLDVVATASAEDALAAIGTGTDLLVTDLHLGATSGLELAAAAEARHPRLRVLIVSGDPAGVGHYACLAKPFTFANLQRALGALLGDAATPLADAALTR